MTRPRNRLLGLAAVLLALPLTVGSALAAPGGGLSGATPTDLARVPDGAQGQSIGGEPASVREHPYVIAALREGGSRPRGQSCSGSVIAPRKVLVAAHCKELQGRKTVLYGLDDVAKPGGTQLNVVDYKTHPSYRHFASGYDVAVITTDADIPVPAGGTPRSPVPPTPGWSSRAGPCSASATARRATATTRRMPVCTS